MKKTTSGAGARRVVAKPSCVEVFGADALWDAGTEVREAVWAAGGMTILRDDRAQTVKIRLLTSERQWVVDRRRRLVYMERVDGRGMTKDRTFPKIFSLPSSSRRALIFGDESPFDVLEAHAERVAKRLVEEFSKGRRAERGYSPDHSRNSLRTFVELRPAEAGADPRTSPAPSWVDAEELEHKTTQYLANRLKGVFSEGGRVLTKLMVKALWAELDREVVRYAVSARGRQTTALDLTLVWQSLESVAEAYRIAPATIPFWLDAQGRAAERRLGLKGGEVPRKVARARVLALGVRAEAGRGVVEEVLREGVGRHLTGRGWRWLVARKPVWVAVLGHEISYTERAAAFVNLMGDLTTLPKLRFLSHLRREWHTLQHYGLFAPGRLPHTLRLLEAAARRSRAIKGNNLAELTDQLGLVLDWWRAESPVLDPNQRKAGWDWYVRRQEEWHRAAALRRRADLEARSWPTSLGSFEEGGWKAVALNDALALYEEGERMHHCVSDYTSGCVDGYTRIYHLERTAGREEHATLELSLSDDGWYLRQVRGHCNGRVSKDCRAFAGRVLAAYKRSLEPAAGRDRAAA